MRLTKSKIKKLLPSQYLNRTLEKEITSLLKTEEVLVIYGARQVGKSSLILKIANEIIEKNPVHYYTLDEYDNQDLQNPKRLIATLHQDLSNNLKTYLIIDEAQRLSNIGIFIKQIYDQKLPLKIILTGSASFAIKSDIKEPLTGRKFEFHLSPLTLEEILHFNNINVQDILGINTQLESILKNYIIYGGYPQVYCTHDYKLKVKRLTEIVDTYINRDLLDLFNLSNTHEVRKVTTYIAENIGNLMSIDKIMSLGGLKKAVVEKILLALKKTFVSYELYPLSSNRFKEIAHRPKIYFHDTGLRNAFLGKLDENLLINDLGHLFENVIGNQLMVKNYWKDVNYWRNINQTEVDFVVKKSQELYGYECKYLWRSSNLPKSLQRFMKNYNARGLVLSRDNYWQYLKD